MYQGQKIVAVIQARMGSSRLPGKVLKPLCDRPVLWHIIERLKRVDLIDAIVVATSDRRQDDDIIDFLEWLDDPMVRAFRGSHEDVLDRLYQALCQDPPDVVVRVTADTPLISPDHLRRLVIHLVEEGLDGVDAHQDTTGLSLGFGSEAYRYQALVDAHLLAVHPEEREHVSLFIKNRPHAFAVDYPEPDPALQANLRLTLDYPEDYELLRIVYRALYRPGEIIDCRQVVQWLESRPDLIEANSHCVQSSPRAAS